MKTPKKILLIPILLVLAIGGSIAAYLYLGRATASQQSADFVAVKRMDLVQTVSATGQVMPASDISLSFERTGKVTSAPAQVGQTVAKGQTLASLDTSDLAIQLDLAQNSLALAQIKLDQLKNADIPSGDASTEIQTAINSSKETSANKIKEAYITADGIMGMSIDQFFSQPKSSNPVFGLTINQGNSTYLINAPIETAFKLNRERRAITNSMDKWENDVNNLDNIDNTQNDAETSLEQIQALLTDLANFINSYNPANASDNLVYGSYKTAVQNSRMTIDTTLAGLLAAKQAYNSSKASANPDDIKMQEIAVANAQGQIESIENQIAKSSVYCPIDGIVSVQDAKAGQTASAGLPLIGVFSNSNLQIDVNLSESDVAKVKPGQAATATLDAFAGQTFAAHVISVDPKSLETSTAGYKTTLQFDQNNSDIKPGMTANVVIETGRKNNVIAVPARSIIQKNGQSYVMVKTDGNNYEEQKISEGIAGANGYVEVIGGLNENKMIINY